MEKRLSHHCFFRAIITFFLGFVSCLFLVIQPDMPGCKSPSKPFHLEIIKGKKTTNEIAEGKNTTNRFLLLGYQGRTGNHLYIYAAAYGLARKTNRIPVTCNALSSFKDLLRSPGIPLLDKAECQTYKMNGSVHYEERSALYYDIGLIQRVRNSPHTTVTAGAYFQNLGYFLEYENEIRNELQLSGRYAKFANRYLQWLARKRQRSCIFVAVHVRRTDYLEVKGQVIPSQPYFIKAMGYFRRKFGELVNFVVITDDLVWATTYLSGENVNFTAHLGWMSTNEDFAIGVACNHTIISVGTFGWWMGYLGGGEVIYPKNYMGRPFLMKWYLPGQMHPSHWIEM